MIFSLAKNKVQKTTSYGMKILIATGVYPPEAGGPSYYAKSLKDEFEKLGHTVVVKTFGIERRMPTGIRHVYYFFKTLLAYLRADCVLVFDTFSVGLPVALMRFFFRKGFILRVGGDFLWEEYVERTREKILLSRFYTEPRNLTLKEKCILWATRFVLRMATNVVFNTHFQKDIWVPAYRIATEKVSIIENRMEPANEAFPASGKTFVYAAARPLVWKNADMARDAFDIVKQKVPEARLEFLFGLPREEAMEKIKYAYACILISLGDLGPNHILRALSFGKPVILAEEVGIRERIGDAAMYVDPFDKEVIAGSIVRMCKKELHDAYTQKVRMLSVTHTYADIAQEFLALCNK